jgi:pyruvate dehydrogenase E2 component (dihydrolipoamide acetyltransferase)
VALEITMPRLSDSMEEGTVLQWLVAEGDIVEQGQPLVEIETDKATVTYEADVAGVILALAVGEGASVVVGSPIALIGEAGEAPAARAVAEPAAAAVGRGLAATQLSGGDEVALAAPRSQARARRAKASPVARRLATELGVELAALAGTGPQGRVVRADVERAVVAGNGESVESDSTRAAPAQDVRASTTPAKGESTAHELTRLQRTVARRMAESRATVPDIELRCEVDMGEAVALREQLREVSDPAPSLNDLIVRAAALALRELPRVNGAFRDSMFECYSRVNVGIAVAAADALIVPTIFDADAKSLAEIAAWSRTLAQRARDGSITPAELEGGTFTVSNLGMYGVDSFSAVINPPQAAILAVGSLRSRPIVADSGEIVARPTIVLTLACDHRIVYGVDGARFLTRVRELLEKPLSLLV